MDKFLFLKKSCDMQTKRKYIVMAAVFFICLVAFAFFYFYAFDKRSGNKEVMLEIPAHATGRQISKILEDNGIVRSAFLFRLAVFVTHEDGTLQSGFYKLHQGLTIRETISELHKGRHAFITITIPEGSNVYQIAEILKKSGFTNTDDFIDVASDYGPLSYMYGPESAKIKAEGFLKADTYDIPKEYTSKQICDLMYKSTDKMLDENIRKRAKAKNMSLHKLMTLASMVEKEALFKEDQKMIASVILARLEKNMPLQIDATVQYVLDWNKKELSVEDTKVASPYNTYMRVGLPPGPIASPGIDAINAVLDAKAGEYLYYVATKDGHHVFSKTYEEHQAQIEKIYTEG